MTGRKAGGGIVAGLCCFLLIFPISLGILNAGLTLQSNQFASPSAPIGQSRSACCMRWYMCKGTNNSLYSWVNHFVPGIGRWWLQLNNLSCSGRFLTEWNDPKVKERLFSASFLISISRGYTGPSYSFLQQQQKATRHSAKPIKWLKSVMHIVPQLTEQCF